MLLLMIFDPLITTSLHNTSTPSLRKNPMLATIMTPVKCISIVFATIFFCISYVIISLSISNKTKFPYNWPFLGTVPAIIANYHQFPEWLAKLGQEKGCTFWLKGPWFANLDMLYTADPADVQYTSSIKYSNFIRGAKSKKAFGDIFRGSVFNSDDFQLWENQRRLLKGFFNRKMFNHQVDKIVHEKVEKGLIPILNSVSGGGSAIDLQEMFLRCTHDISSMLLFGYDSGKLSTELPEISVPKAINISMEVAYRRHLTLEFLWKSQSILGIGKEKQWSKAKQVIDHYIDKHAGVKDELLNERRSSGFKDNDDQEYFHLYKKFVAEEKIFQALADSDGYIEGSIMAFMVAAQNTTTASLTWFFWIISKYPSIKERIQEELRSHLPLEKSQKPYIFSVEDVIDNKLVYLHATFCETLRLYPVVPFQIRYPVERDMLPSGHKVNPNTMIVIPLYTMGRMKSIWGEDCQEFKPERWISLEVDGQHSIKQEPSHKFFVFGSGPRTCPGKDLSFIETETIAATILHNYDVQLVENHDPSSVMSITSEMKNGLPARITKRWT